MEGMQHYWMRIRGILNGPVDRHSTKINLFVDKFLLHELIFKGQKGVRKLPWCWIRNGHEPRCVVVNR